MTSSTINQYVEYMLKYICQEDYSHGKENES